MNWAKRIPSRPIRRATSDYPGRYFPVCGRCGLLKGFYDLSLAEEFRDIHTEQTGHQEVEVIRAEEINDRT